MAASRVYDLSDGDFFGLHDEELTLEARSEGLCAFILLMVLLPLKQSGIATSRPAKRTILTTFQHGTNGRNDPIIRANDYDKASQLKPEILAPTHAA